MSAAGPDTNWLNGVAPAGKKRVGFARGQPPMRRCGLVGGGIEVVAKRRADSLLMAAADADILDDGNPRALLGRLEQLEQRGELGVQLLDLKLGARGSGTALGFARLRAIFGGFGGGKLAFQRLDQAGEPVELNVEGREIGVASACSFELGKLLGDVA